MTAVNRREFFKTAPAAAAAAALSPVVEVRPATAYVVMTPNWEYNDEYHYTTGDDTLALNQIFYDKAAAEAAAEERNERFYKEADTPADYFGEVDDDWDEICEASPTDEAAWRALVAADLFNPPYYVQELPSAEAQKAVS